MAEWHLKVPGGVVPKNLPVYVALGVVAVLLLVMFLTGSGAPTDESAAGGEQAIEAAVADVRNVVEPVLREGERLREDLARLEAQREADAEERRRQEAAARDDDLADARLELEGARAALLEAQRIRDAAESSGFPPGSVAGDIQTALGTVEERELREAIRLQELERFALSLRAPAVVGDRDAAATPRSAAPAERVITGDPLVDEQLLALMRQEAAAGQVPSPPPPPERAGAPEVVPVRPAPAAGVGDRAAASPTEFYAVGPDIEVPESSGRGSVAVARWPAVPEGLDLVYEGRMMQAVLETALTGDFTGPARARLTLPVRTADRRRVVIPRGTVALGDVQAVENGFQTRLAVRFSRLRFPDGRSVRMGFEGLSSIGETGLTDEVNRHYRSTLGAVGAVGLLAGLSAGGGGSQGYFDPARQQFSVAAIRFLDRFVNRLPEVRVRAGHPVRIYLTQDLLVPRV